MAILNGPLHFTGSIGKLTFYQEKHSGQTIVREKTSHSGKRTKKDPRFKRRDQMAAEWAGCVTTFKWLHRLLKPLDATADYPFSGALQGLVKPIQKLDTEGAFSRRSVWLSSHPHLREGFTLTRQPPFDTLVRTPLLCTIQKEALSARVMIPELVTRLNFRPHTPQPFFRVVASLGVVPDVHYSPYGYAPELPAGALLPCVAATEWTGVKKGLAETMLELQLPYTLDYPTFSLVLAVAVSFGTLDVLGNVQAVPHSGSGRIVKVE